MLSSFEPEFGGVERRSSLHPGVERIRSDRVEFLVSRQEIMPGIIDDYFSFRIVDNVEVVLSEVPGYNLRHQRLNLYDRELFYGWIYTDRSGSHSGPTADYHNRLRLEWYECRQVPQHSLETHILWFTRCLHFPSVVVIPDTAT